MANAYNWRLGPNLPFGIKLAQLVEDNLGGVILVGGSSQVEIFDTLFRLPHAGDDANWEEMPQKLKDARDHHTAFLIPDHLTNCTLNEK